jgi:hypothetical protein
MKYQVKTASEVIVTRTSKKAAEQDVRLLKDICRKAAWVEEVES